MNSSLASMLLAGHAIPSGRSRCALVYIAFAPFGPKPFKAFIASYERHRPGIDHDLYILCKGFANNSDTKEFLKAAATVACTALRVPDGGFDLGTYHHIARRLDASHFCFLNTRSVILVGDWLKMLYEHCLDERVGAAGATASCESLYTDYLRSIAEGLRKGNSLRTIVHRSFLNRWRHRYLFNQFPNPHLRTNAFMVRSDVFNRMNFGAIRSRLDTARLENGRGSITRQLARMGLDAIVVGRDGCAYGPPDWRHSDTFWQGEQGNLLVADNQTEKYALADATGRARLSCIAWGNESGSAGGHRQVAR